MVDLGHVLAVHDTRRLITDARDVKQGLDLLLARVVHTRAFQVELGVVGLHCQGHVKM